MTDTDLLAFLTHFADTRDWATWDAIADAYADVGDEIGERVANEVKREEYYPLQRKDTFIFSKCYQWLEPVQPSDTKWKSKERKASLPERYMVAINRIPFPTVVDAYSALIDAMRRHYEQPQEV